MSSSNATGMFKCARTIAVSAFVPADSGCALTFGYRRGTVITIR